MYTNKFEVPLTMQDTENIFNILNNNNYKSFIQSVYIPPHANDAGSGRAFEYNYSRKDYYNLINRLSQKIEVILTYPIGNPRIMHQYIRHGIKRFMVSKWHERYDVLKKKYPDLIIERSIVGNAYNETIDYRFDGIVIPYKWLLNIEKLKKESKKINLIGLVNHHCMSNCLDLDNHPQASLGKNVFKNSREFKCSNPANNTSFFIPKEILDKTEKYYSTIKLVDRNYPTNFYLPYIDYYVNNKKLKLPVKRFHDLNLRTIENYKESDMMTIMCGFQCETCQNKCF